MLELQWHTQRPTDLGPLSRRCAVGLASCVAGVVTIVGTVVDETVAAFARPKAASTSSVVEGTFVSAPDDSTIYIVQGGMRQAFPDWDTYLAWSGTHAIDQVVHLSASELMAIPLGDGIAAGSRP